MPQHRLLALTEHLPGYDVRMVLQPAHDDLIPFGDISFSKGEGECIQTIRRAFREHDLIAALRSDERSHSFPGLFVFHRCYLA